MGLVADACVDELRFARNGVDARLGVLLCLNGLMVVLCQFLIRHFIAIGGVLSVEKLSCITGIFLAHFLHGWRVASTALHSFIFLVRLL